MSKPKDMTPEQEEEWKQRNRKRVKDWQIANPDRKRQSQRTWAKQNPEDNKERQRRFYQRNRERLLEKHKKYRESNRNKSRSCVNKSMNKAKMQKASDQFFIMAGAAEQLSNLTKPTPTE